MDKYPLEELEYIKLADHYIADSYSSIPDLVELFPFKDVKYKEIIEKNRK